MRVHALGAENTPDHPHDSLSGFRLYATILLSVSRDNRNQSSPSFRKVALNSVERNDV